MKKLTKEQINWLKAKAKKEDIPFMFIASPYLCDQISKGTHPLLKDLPDPFKLGFLQQRAVSVSTKMVIDFLENKLDAKNNFILSNGEIRVIDNSAKVDKGN